MQKLTTIAWLKETLRKTKGRRKMDYTRMYFRYESLQEIREKLDKGGILSGLTIKIDAETILAGHFWIVYGKKGSIMNIVSIVMERDEETSKVLCGINYHKYFLAEGDIEEDKGQKEDGLHLYVFQIQKPPGNKRKI